MIILWAIILVLCVAYGIHRGRFQVREMKQNTGPTEKPGRIYFLENQNSSDRVKIVKSRGELATPLRVRHEIVTDAPNAVLAQIYRDLDHAHLGAGWYDSDAVRMYIDHLRGAA